MNTKILMIASAVFLGILGVGLTFLSEEIAAHFGKNLDTLSHLTLQILGSLYLGFAMVNWMAKNNLMGGIYGKPLNIGNLVHFLVSAFALIKLVFDIKNHTVILVLLTFIYIAFTLGFGIVFMNSPRNLGSKEIK